MNDHLRQIRNPMNLYFMRLVACEGVNVSHPDIVNTFSLGDLTDYLHLADAIDARHAHEQQKMDREAKKNRP